VSAPHITTTKFCLLTVAGRELVVKAAQVDNLVVAEVQAGRGGAGVHVEVIVGESKGFICSFLG
jgi:hypothetical protein